MRRGGCSVVDACPWLSWNSHLGGKRGEEAEEAEGGEDHVFVAKQSEKEREREGEGVCEEGEACCARLGDGRGEKKGGREDDDEGSG